MHRRASLPHRRGGRVALTRTRTRTLTLALALTRTLTRTRTLTLALTLTLTLTLTGAEVSLVLLFESVGGPLWVFVGFGDVPSPWTLASGALLIGALVGHEIASMYAQEEDVDDWGSPGAPGLISSPRGAIPQSPAFRPGSSPLPVFSSPRLSSSPMSPLSLNAVTYGVPLLVATLSPERRGANSMAARMAGRPAVPAPRGRYEPPAGVSRRNSS